MTIADLDELRSHLNIPIADTMPDATLEFFLEAADDILLQRVGDILPQTYSEAYDGGTSTIFLRHTPVISIDQIVESYGFASYTLDLVSSGAIAGTDLYSYSIDDAETGTITRRSAGSVVVPFVPGTKNISVTYSAGRDPVPAVVKLAALELCRHWWSTTQLRSSGQGTGRYGEEAVSELPQLVELAGVPWNVELLLQPFKRTPIFG